METDPILYSVSLELPGWLKEFNNALASAYATDESRMRLAIDLAARNVSAGTGGPFGAAIFESDSGKVVSVGVNRVVPLHNSTAHAEMMAFMLAQQRMGNHRLDSDRHHFVMATSAQPCAMCYGASVWAGINRILVGARREDVESLTEFDEGPLPKNWIEELRERGITVRRDILREEACAVLQDYQRRSGIRY